MIEVNNLTKRYGDHTAVDSLSFSVPEGQVFGFLGPNGAGKSTTLNIVTGCLAATSGEVTIAGYDIFEEEMKAKKLIGYLPEQPPLYMDSTPMEYLTFVGMAKGLSGKELKKSILHAMDVTKITQVSQRLIKNLSKGYRQRVGIAQAILGDPKVVILDEPSVGLDPLQIVEIRGLIKSLGKSYSVVFSSHILSEVQSVCDRILIINKGKFIACDTPENLEHQFKGKASVELLVEASKGDARQALKTTSAQNIHITQKKENRCEITLDAPTDDDAVLKELFFAFSRMGKPILYMNRKQASLEDVFISLTRESQER